MRNTINVTKENLRDYFINYHGYNEFFELTAEQAIERIFGRLRSVQYDPLNVVGRNAELVLFSRSANVTRADLYNALYRSRVLVDGWDKMMCIYAAADFTRFAYLREQATKNYAGVMSWRGQNECHRFTENVYSYIKEHGSTLVTDIPSEKTNSGGWGSSRVAGVCCEYLWNSGRIVVSDKKGTVKHFDITERALGVNASDNAFDSFDDFLAWYVKRRISSLGVATIAKGSGWLGVFLEDDKLRKGVMEKLTESGELTAVKVDGIKNEFYINSGDEKYFKQSENDRSILLAPLDNMIWDRKVINSVFGFDYSWEVYTPQTKRKYGYYVLPIIIGNRFVGRVEPVLNKERTLLSVKNIWFEPDTALGMNEADLIISEINRLAAFVDAECDGEVKDTVYSGLRA